MGGATSEPAYGISGPTGATGVAVPGPSTAGPWGAPPGAVEPASPPPVRGEGDGDAGEAAGACVPAAAAQTTGAMNVPTMYWQRP